ncbi:cation:proton antiporter [Pseudonocardia sp. KRD-184]|uniref:Cation:proton antiporter n=1 Tax=Pseudonocardia oceani TaxID=2792013 RepID=A0ABS6UGE2_9PSEU|nr:cation:proton antiporter [Pseudonocardia oceani]MBW0092679.1 cation:proton antiporter [Pseudonocardia oceani]MBW0099409.1 cation:proton antiporter [Pseudonocardia oceani]MBW0111984.1 cation:proton antiporter [Pseudonocardia oceani]MBW0131307.1 cation:proton antiporter [Pseudonocardia oceani]
MDPLLVSFAVTVLVLGMVSRLLKRHALSPVLLALGVGVLVGPAVLGWIDPAAAVGRTRLLEELTRIGLALGVADIALQVTRADLRRNARRLVLLLTAVMVGMWLLTAGGAWLLLGVPVGAALLLGAALTPTDPVVASALAGGALPKRMLPRRLRRTLQTESGANDGLALPFVLLAGLLATETAGSAVAHWAVEAGREVGLAVVIGPLLGWAVARLARAAAADELIGSSYVPLLGVATALAALGLVHLLGGSGVLGAFLAALALSLTLPDVLRGPVGEMLSAASRLGVVAVFGVFGTVLPWAGWLALGVPGLLFAAWALLVRRPPVAGAVLLASGTGPHSRLFLSWFGPLGVAGIYYLAYAERYGLPGYERLFAAGSLAICASVLVHTLTSTPAVRWYARRSGTERAEGESAEVEGPLP